MFREAPWWIFSHCKTAENKYDVFKSTAQHILDIHAPLKDVRVKYNKKPWITGEYGNINKDVEQARKRYRKTKSLADLQTTRNYVTQQIA